MVFCEQIADQRIGVQTFFYQIISFSLYYDLILCSKNEFLSNINFHLTQVYRRFTFLLLFDFWNEINEIYLLKFILKYYAYSFARWLSLDQEPLYLALMEFLSFDICLTKNIRPLRLFFIDFVRNGQSVDSFLERSDWVFPRVSTELLSNNDWIMISLNNNSYSERRQLI